ncbi:MAG: hypothetical protein PW734_08285 [Verrucomicrobium sp.]|nr:hypothetical protein [Verrucomicrobium sp.]
MTQTIASTDFAPEMGPQDPAEYDKWFRAKVQASLDDPRPSIPHAQVMAEMDAIISKAVARRTDNGEAVRI